MRITKRRLRKIIREAVQGHAAGGPNAGKAYIDIAMDALASGDTLAATNAILGSYMMDDTWNSEEDALEDMLIDLGPNPTVEGVEAVAAEWIEGYRAGAFRPQSHEEMKKDWARRDRTERRRTGAPRERGRY